MKKIVLVVALLLITGQVFGATFKRAKTFEDAYNASCRVSVANARGTGTFVGIDKANNRAIILTNYHVVTTNTNATLDFWTNGVRQSVSGRVFSRIYDAKMPADFAFIEVDVAELEKINPPYIALGGKDAAPDANSYIISAGAPKGRFVQAWKGKVLGYYNGSTVMFQPGPVPGQSGSAVVSEINGELWVTAVLTWLLGTEGSDDSRGGAIPIANLYASLNGQQNTLFNGDESPIPPDAVECAEKAPYVVEFIRDNCEPCSQAKEDVKKISATGVQVKVVNTSIEKNRSIAEKNKIQFAPTFIVFNGQDEEFSRYVGPGVTTRVLDDIEQLKKAETAKESVPPKPKVEEPKPEPEPLGSYESHITPNFTRIPEVAKPEVEDFRHRAPIYESFDASFLEDSNSLWANRNKGKGEETSPTPKFIAPKKEEPEVDENKLYDKLGSRLLGKISTAISEQVNGAVKTVETKVDKRISDTKKELLLKWNHVKYMLLFTVIVTIILTVVVSNLITQFINNLFKGSVRAMKAGLVALLVPDNDEISCYEEPEEVPERVFVKEDGVIRKATTKKKAKK